MAIRVVPEFDNPGHARAIGLDPEFREIILCFDKDWPSTVRPDGFKVKGGPPSGLIDPSKNKTYELIKGLFEDMNNTFIDNMIHLGGDEALTSCYDENPAI